MPGIPLPTEVMSLRVPVAGRSKPVGLHVYYVYILSNPRNTVLYTGVTNNLARRLYEHRRHVGHHFTQRYNTSKLVYYEQFTQILDAINREK